MSLDPRLAVTISALRQADELLDEAWNLPPEQKAFNAAARDLLKALTPEDITLYIDKASGRFWLKVGSIQTPTSNARAINTCTFLTLLAEAGTWCLDDDLRRVIYGKYHKRHATLVTLACRTRKRLRPDLLEFNPIQKWRGTTRLNPRISVHIYEKTP